MRRRPLPFSGRETVTSISFFSFVGMYDKALDATAHILAKGAAHAAAQGVSDQDFLGWKLVDDMLPLSFQLSMVINFSQSYTARAAGIDVPPALPADLDVAGFQAAITAAKAFLATLTPDQFAGREDVPATIKLGDVMEPTLPIGQWVTGFATTNIHFHLSMVYGILRMRGVAIGKADLFPTGL
jgi:hypothetical protein